MIIELDDGYAFIASTSSNDGDVSGLHGPPGGPPGGSNDIWVVRLNEQMEIIWQKCIGGYSSDNPIYITQTTDDGFIVIGFTKSNDGDVSGNNSYPGTYTDIWVVKLSEHGVIEWQHCYGGWGRELLENPHTVLRKSDYNYVLASSTNYSPSFDVMCGTINITTNAWVFEIKLDDTVNIITPASEAQEISVYPNPAGDFVEFKVKSEKLKVAELRLYDVFGRQAAGKQITSEQTVLDVSGLPGGVYFYRVYPVSSGVALDVGMYSGKIVIQR